MAEVASHWQELGDQLRWPLTEMWVTGELLTFAETLERGAVVLVMDLPAEELPWLALHTTAEAIGHQLRLGKRPLHWCYRPRAWPVWTYQNRRVLRFWSAENGLDSAAIEALRSRRLEHLAVVEPSDDELATQLRTELAASRAHLGSVLEGYWDRDWRRRHKGYDESPQEHLWRAATAVAELLDAVDTLTD
ncbi:hypothetical protein C1Y40_00249 [Mycobacterium talmoniae]|uniref:DUF7711 domain-containing protein n=2 Tax=Mycobacterium talmoniae TaxID=1858794 RepID=A0A1S1NK65_9MYCO|nr:hypothetical protein [Mycobacterium eburneum]OHV06614.1 hypothetical protein BKN37_01155 [Mycobacterium talmoniae]PQM49533.1 hypothetical protein C1Y40_00249 [Mycobacterium talmoniae]TDH55517.1 hypothetical protein E2F47_09970 [Mycobacterium eburneum]